MRLRDLRPPARGAVILALTVAAMVTVGWRVLPAGEDPTTTAAILNSPASEMAQLRPSPDGSDADGVPTEIPTALPPFAVAPDDLCPRGADQLACRAWANRIAVVSLARDRRHQREDSPTNNTVILRTNSISVGRNHACGITSTRQAACWGNNETGQLGDGSYLDRPSPVLVTGLDAGVRQVSVGSNHSCAVTDRAQVMCWGDNSGGALGDDSHTSRPVARLVIGLPPIRVVSAGGGHSCAIDTDGHGWCWGANEHGQLGVAVVAAIPRVVRVTGVSVKVTAVALGSWHTCAITTTHRVWCWGANGAGQTGSLASDDVRPPNEVPGLLDAKSLTAGDWHSCITTQRQSLWCWGSNAFGQLGLASGRGGTSGIGEVRGAAVVRVIAGSRRTCADLQDGTPLCWGV